MSAIERDLIAFTKAHVRWMEFAYAERPHPKGKTVALLRAKDKACAALLRRGMRLLRKEQGNAQ